MSLPCKKIAVCISLCACWPMHTGSRVRDYVTKRRKGETKEGGGKEAEIERHTQVTEPIT
jgi:hypothetical protein